MKKLCVIFVALILSTGSLSSQDLKLSLKIDSVYNYGFEEKVFYTELTALKKVTTPDLETALLEFKLYKDEEMYSPPYMYGFYARGGPGRTILQPGPPESGTEEYIYIETPQNFVDLQKDQGLLKKFDLSEMFESGLVPGRYSLLVIYENGLEVETNFRVHVSYKKVIPKIIQGISDNIIRDGKSLLREFYYLLGYPKDFSSMNLPPDSLHYKQAPVLRAWWNENKELILKVESVLNQEKYKNILYEERVPKLLKQLEKGGYQEQLEARDQLFEILGRPKWKPSESDTEDKVKAQIDEVVKWWKENEDLINWVNRVLLENKL